MLLMTDSAFVYAAVASAYECQIFPTMLLKMSCNCIFLELVNNLGMEEF